MKFAFTQGWSRSQILKFAQEKASRVAIGRDWAYGVVSASIGSDRCPEGSCVEDFEEGWLAWSCAGLVDRVPVPEEANSSS